MQATVLILLIIVFMWIMYYGSEKAKKWSLVIAVVVGALMFYYNFVDTRPVVGGDDSLLKKIEGSAQELLTVKSMSGAWDTPMSL